MEKFKEKLIMELGEKLLFDQHNVTYPPVNPPTVQEPPKVATTVRTDENLFEEPKAKMHGVETQTAATENIFEDKVGE